MNDDRELDDRELDDLYKRYQQAKQRGMPNANRLLAEYLGALNDRQASEVA